MMVDTVIVNSQLESVRSVFFFFNDTATTEIYTLSLHDALPISATAYRRVNSYASSALRHLANSASLVVRRTGISDRKSTRLNSSHANISYAVFCLKKNATLPPSR